MGRLIHRRRVGITNSAFEDTNVTMGAMFASTNQTVHALPPL